MIDFKLWVIKRKIRRIRKYQKFIDKTTLWLLEEDKEVSQLIKEYDHNRRH